MNWNAYHFTSAALRDGQPIPAIGETLVFDGPLRMCSAGYHASRKVWQALEYAPGALLHRVHCGGELIELDDKLVCRERTIIASIDAEPLLWKYARMSAWAAPDVVRAYLETGHEELRAAAGVAEEAARAAAGAADSARVAIRTKQRRRLTAMVNAEFAK